MARRKPEPRKWITERAIRDKVTGVMHTEWSVLSREAIVEVILSAQGAWERYEIIIREVTEWRPDNAGPDTDA